MLTEKQFEGLKKVNLSVDAQKSKERISSDFKEAASDVKKRIIELSGLNRATFYNAFQRGSASPKMVLAMAQSLGVSPYYYTGESDDKSDLDEEILGGFITEKELFGVAKAPAKRKTTAKKATTARKTPGRKPKKVAEKPVAEPKKRGRKPINRTPEAAAPAEKPAAYADNSAKSIEKSNEVIMQISIEKTPTLDRAVANLDEETAVLLFRALIKKADANEKAKALCNVIKSCLLS